MDDFKLWNLFSPYLNQSDENIPTSELGLVDNAPPEAVEAYIKFQKYEAEGELDSD